jgi:hypothetical protein
VILTPWDMSCGWDEHTHEHGARLIPGDALRLGINIVSYVAGCRPLGEVQAVTRAIQAPADRPRQTFTLAQLRHQGDWNPDPNSVTQWLRQVAGDSSLAVGFDLKAVDATEAQLAPYPFLYLTGHRDPKLTDEEVAALRRHLQSGGFLFINNCCGRSAFDQQARALAGRIFPDQALAAIAPEHPLLRSFYTVTEARDRQSGAARPLELEGITVKDRLVLVYSKNDTGHPAQAGQRPVRQRLRRRLVPQARRQHRGLRASELKGGALPRGSLSEGFPTCRARATHRIRRRSKPRCVSRALQETQ